MTSLRGRLDAYLAVVSKREVRRYTDEPIPDAVLTAILHGGRATGSARNRQHWRFVVVRGREALEALAPCVAAPENVAGCNAAVAVVLTGPMAAWDGGRLAQNMMVAAWAFGVGSCPNTVTPDGDAAARELLGVRAAGEESFVTILSLGYPAEPVPRSDDPEAVLQRINRKPLAELVTWVGADAGDA